jgi:hypothetical protein
MDAPCSSGSQKGNKKLNLTRSFGAVKLKGQQSTEIAYEYLTDDDLIRSKRVVEVSFMR